MAQTFALKHYISINLGDPVTNATVHNTLEFFRSTNEFYTDRQILTDFLEVSTIVTSLKNRKSPGIDGINKALPNRSLKFLTIIINASYFPREFKESKIIPIRKSRLIVPCLTNPLASVLNQ